MVFTCNCYRTNGSFSPVHKHLEYSEAFVILEGALAFFVFTDDGIPTCHVISNKVEPSKRAIIVEKNTIHAMTAAPPELGYPGYAVVFETSGHKFDTSKPTKVLNRHHRYSFCDYVSDVV